MSVLSVTNVHCYLLSKQSKDALLCRPESNLCFCTTWQKGETQKLHFSLKCCISALPEFNQLLDIFNLFDLRLTLTLLYDSLNLVVNAFSNVWENIKIRAHVSKL